MTFDLFRENSPFRSFHFGKLALAFGLTLQGHALDVSLVSGSNAGPWEFDAATNIFTATGSPAAIDGQMSGSGILLLQPTDPNNAVRFVDVNAAATYTGITRLRSVDARFGVRLGVNNAFPIVSELQFETTNQGSGRPVWLDLNGFSQQFAGIGHTGSNYNAVVNGNSEQAGSLIVSNNTAVTYSSLLGADNAHSNITATATGILDGSGNNFSFTKSGSASLTLTRENSYTGDTIIEEGILSIQNPYLHDMSSVSLSAGAVLDLDFAETDVINSLSLGGVDQPAGIWGAIGSGAERESSFITGTGLLNVTTGSAISTEPKILVFTPVGDDVWELTLKGQAATGYRIISSETLSFDSGNVLGGLFKGDSSDPGVIGGAGETMITTDATGIAKIRVTLPGASADFVRAEVAL